MVYACRFVAEGVEQCSFFGFQCRSRAYADSRLCVSNRKDAFELAHHLSTRGGELLDLVTPEFKNLAISRDSSPCDDFMERIELLSFESEELAAVLV